MQARRGGSRTWTSTLLDPHGGDLGGFFMVHGSAEQCSALAMDEEFRRACIDASLIVENFGVVPAATGAGVAEEMTMYTEAVAQGRRPRARGLSRKPGGGPAVRRALRSAGDYFSQGRAERLRAPAGAGLPFANGARLAAAPRLAGGACS